MISCLENEISLPASYFSVHLSLCDQNVASYIFANMCNVHVDSLAHFRALKPSFLRSISGWLDGRTEISGRPYSKSGLSAHARHTGQEKAEATSHLWGRLGILLQRGNAAILGNRVPALPGAHIDGIL